MTARGRPLLALLTGLLLVVAACGIPEDDSPRLIAEEPEGLATTSQPADNTPGARTVQVFLIDGRAADPTLAGRDRTTELQPSPLEAVDRLLDGTTDQDDVNQYATAIPGDTRRLPSSRADPGDDTIVLDLSGELSDVAGELGLRAYAQLVYTVTQYDRSAGVRFRIDGDPIRAPSDDGQLAEVHRRNYRSLQPDS